MPTSLLQPAQASADGATESPILYWSSRWLFTLR